MNSLIYFLNLLLIPDLYFLFSLVIVLALVFLVIIINKWLASKTSKAYIFYISWSVLIAGFLTFILYIDWPALLIVVDNFSNCISSNIGFKNSDKTKFFSIIAGFIAIIARGMEGMSVIAVNPS